MLHSSFFHRLSAIIFAVVLSHTAMVVVAAQPRTSSEPGAPLLLQIGVGSSNGARIGASYRVAPHVEAELSFGYVRMVNYIQYPDKSSTSVGLTPGLGISYTSNDRPVSKAIASFLVAYQVGSKKIVYAHERRLALSACIGADLHLTRDLVLRWRAGPCTHIILQPIRGDMQFFMQYDGALGWRI